MALISFQASSLVGGVSQQPDAIRLPSQVAEMDNAYPTLVGGAQKRAHTEHVALLGYLTLPDYYFHWINRSTTERYLVAIKSASGRPDIKVWTLAGTSVFVKYTAAGDGYLDTFLGSSVALAKNVRVLTVADYTFLLDRTSNPTSTNNPSAAQSNTGLCFIHVRAGNYESSYKVAIKQGAGALNTVYVDTWDGTAAAAYCQGASGNDAIACAANGGTWQVAANQLQSIATDDIADALRVKLAAIAGLTVTRQGSVLKITSATAFTQIEVGDSLADTALLLLNGTVVAVDDLPPNCQDGTVITVTGLEDTDLDEFYVEFVADTSGAFGPGHWEESLAYNTNRSLTAATMPHLLIRKQDDGLGTVTGTPNAIYFDYDVASWANRLVGDTTSCPDPSFVGTQISNAFFYRDRLGFVAGDHVVLSEAGSYFNFFRTTVQQVLDTDPIDIQPGDTKVSIFQNSLPIDRRLVLFTDRSQFVLDADPVLTPSTVSLTPALSYGADIEAAPLAAGKTGLWSYNRGSFSGIRELFYSTERESLDAADVTVAVPSYIEGTVVRSVVNTQEDTAAFLTNTATNTLWIYKYEWSGNEKIHSAWCKWTFPGAIVKSMEFYENYLYLVVLRGSALYMERLLVTQDAVDTGDVISVALDRRKYDSTSATGTYNSTLDQTVWALSNYDIAADEDIMVVTGPNGETSGSALTVVSRNISTPGAHTITTSGTKPASAYIGLRYAMSVELSKPLLKEQTDSGGRRYVANASVRVLRGLLTYANSEHFKVTVTPDYGDTYEYVFNSGPLGGLFLGEHSLEDGVFRFPVMSQAEHVTVTISNDSPLPCRITSVEWEALYNQRASRLQ